MWGEETVVGVELDVRERVLELIALLEELLGVGEGGEAPSETWRAFNLSNVARGRVEECRGAALQHSVHK